MKKRFLKLHSIIAVLFLAALVFVPHEANAFSLGGFVNSVGGAVSDAGNWFSSNITQPAGKFIDNSATAAQNTLDYVIQNGTGITQNFDPTGISSTINGTYGSGQIACVTLFTGQTTCPPQPSYPAAICTFAANPISLPASPYTSYYENLSWNCSNVVQNKCSVAERVYDSDGNPYDTVLTNAYDSSIKAVNLSASSSFETLANGAAHEYVLSCNALAGGSVQYSAFVNTSSPVSCAFSASPSLIVEGTPSTLSWSCTNADSCSIDNGIGSVSNTGGTRQVTPSKSTDYTLSCNGSGGSKTIKSSVTVFENPICTLTINPQVVVPPQSATLSWSCVKAVSCSIDQGIGSVSATGGSKTVIPDKDTDYTLSCNGQGNAQAQAKASFQTSVKATTFQIKEVAP